MPFRGLGVINDRIAVFQADNIVNSMKRLVRPPEIHKLMSAVKVRGIENDVIMHMGFIYVRGNDKGMAAFRKPQGYFMPQSIS